VYEDAITASFMSYFHDEGDSSRKQRFWRLFHQIARGVQYLHNQRIKHGDLKCSNLVVSANGTAKVCDFVERASTRVYGRHMRERSVRWKAPECVISNGPDPSFEADVFALGLCLIEAWVGETPYGMQSDDEIEILFRTGHTLERPDNLPDSVWNAVKQLCAFDPANRPTIDEVVTLFRELADQEQRNEEEEEAARVATAPTDTTDKTLVA
jgi:serine/threonine protein kinase